MGWPGGFGVPSYPAAPPYSAVSSPEQETQALKAKAEHFEAALADIRKRLAELEVAEEKSR
jgi:hypothetical protein